MIPPTEVIASLYARSKGNPLSLTEVVRLLSERGELGEATSSVIQAHKYSWGFRGRSGSVPTGGRNIVTGY